MGFLACEPSRNPYKSKPRVRAAGEIGYYRIPNVGFLYNKTPNVCFSEIGLQTITISYNDILIHLTIFPISQIHVFSDNDCIALLYYTPIHHLLVASTWSLRLPPPRPSLIDAAPPSLLHAAAFHSSTPPHAVALHGWRRTAACR